MIIIRGIKAPCPPVGELRSIILFYFQKIFKESVGSSNETILLINFRDFSAAWIELRFIGMTNRKLIGDKNLKFKIEILRNDWCKMLNRIIADERSAATKAS